jgi:predicted DNA repair protein MutK
LGTVQGSPFVTQVTVLCGIALLMTVGVYGLVAGIVKLDDGGLYLSRRAGEGAWARLQRSLGLAILWAAPWLMKGLSVAGTIAMFLVGGGILTHGFAPLHHFIEVLTQRVADGAGAFLAGLTPLLMDAVVGLAAGALVLLAVGAIKRVRPRLKS